MLRELTPDQWAKAKAVFADLTDSSELERQAVLETMDLDLRAEVEGLLSNHETAKRKQRLLDQPAASLSSLFESIGEPSAFEARQVLIDRFEIVRLIGRGGMGEVYEALDSERAELVAIKTIRFDLVQDTDILNRFRAEAYRSRLVSHPNICGSNELFHIPRDQSDPGIPFFSMELLRGKTLEERIRTTGPMTELDALVIAQQICSGLAAAHSAGLVHADLKSSNVIFVFADGPPWAKITDFGLARQLPSDGDSVITGSVEESISGTLAYMAPELLEGRRPNAASDIYALGVVLYRMMTGQHPFEAKADLVSAAMRMRHPAPSPRKHVPQLSRAWERGILACLAADPRTRPATAALVAGMLEDSPSAKWAFRKRLALHHLSRRAVIGAGGIAALGLVTTGVWVRLHAPPFADRATAVLVEDIESPDPGAALGRAVRNMVKVAWFGSSQLQALRPDVLSNAAKVVGLGAVPIRGDAALKLARQAGAEITLRGSITLRGRRFRIRLEVIRVKGDEKITMAEGSGSNSGDIAPVVETLCSAIHTALTGPSRAGSPGTMRIEPANTLMPDALESFTSGLAFLQYGDTAVALDNFQTATRLDPEFAIAYVYEAITHGTLRHDDRAFEAASRAFALRNRVQDRQRVQTDAEYYYFSGDFEKALELQRFLATSWPGEAQLHRHVAQTYASMDLVDDALKHAYEAVEIDPRGATNYMVLTAVLAQAGKFSDARQVLTSGLKQIGDDCPALVSSDANLRITEGDVPGALAALNRLERYPAYASHAYSQRVQCLLIYGPLGEARTRLENDIAVNDVKADMAHGDLSRWWLAQLENLIGTRETATRHAAELAGRPAQPYSLFALRCAAQAASDANAPAVIETAISKLKTITAAYPSTRATSFLLQAEGLWQQVSEHMQEATTLLTRAHQLWPDIANAFRLARLFLAAGAFANALPLFESVIARKGAAIHWEQQIAWVLSLPAAAQCCRALNRKDQEKEYQETFVRHWGTETRVPLVRTFLRP